MSQHTREELVYLAKLAEQCERYDGKLTLLRPNTQCATPRPVMPDDHQMRTQLQQTKGWLTGWVWDRGHFEFAGKKRMLIECSGLCRDGQLLDPVRKIGRLGTVAGGTQHPRSGVQKRGWHAACGLARVVIDPEEGEHQGQRGKRAEGQELQADDRD